MGIAIGGIQTGPGVDFDLFVRCGAPPTPTQFDQVSNSFDSQEFIHIQNFCLGTTYITVHSYSGAGAFWIAKTSHLSTAHRTLLVNKNWTGAPDNRPGWSQMLTKLAKRTYAVTEGNVYINEIRLYNGPHCDSCGTNPNGTLRKCNLCFKNVCCGASSGVCSGAAELLNNVWFDDKMGAHELGHLFYCVGDEYFAGNANNTQCGHSIMGNHNLDDQQNVCSPFDHKKDKNPSTPATSLPSAREQAANNGIGLPWDNLTPDGYDYTDFDFNNQIGVVTLVN
jgi:hypothetical protein